MQAVIYTRVSTEEQAHRGFSLESQKHECLKKARELGVEPVGYFADEGVSGTILERPGLSAARQRLLAGDVSHFICLDPDRLARRLSHQLLITDEVEKAGVRLVFVNFEWRDSPEGRLFYAMRGAIAEYEREKIVERTTAGKLQKAREGKLTHAPGTYGYRFDKETDTLEIVDHEAGVVQEMYRLASLDGRSCQSIAERLNGLGIPSPRGKSWSRATVRRILRNPTYTGTLYLRQYDTRGANQNRYRPYAERAHVKRRPETDWIAVNVPAIIDRRVWSDAQSAMSRVPVGGSGAAKHEYLLSRLVVCGRCGSRMHGDLISSRGKKRAYYVCTAKSPGRKGIPRCPSFHFPAGELDDAVFRAVFPAVIKACVSHPAWSDCTPLPHERHFLELTPDSSQAAGLTFEQKRMLVRIFVARVMVVDRCTVRAEIRLSATCLEPGEFYSGDNVSRP